MYKRQALSWADGIAKARRVQGERERHTVAVIGDGALTGGMAWEALNNIAADKDLPLVIVVNDNARSYAPTKGGLADHLATLRTKRGYESVLDFGKVALSRTPVVGGVMYLSLIHIWMCIRDRFNGAVSIASITSCTNTSTPSVMIACLLYTSRCV